MLYLPDIKKYVLDMDGTLYLGNIPIPGAPEFVQRIKSCGRSVIFFTNNTSKSKETYYNRLISLGFNAESGEVYSSGDVTADFLLKQRAGKPVYVVGTEALISLFESAGVPVSRTGIGAEIVVCSFDTTLTYEKLATACNLIREGAEFLSTHPDINCPTETGFIPDSGSIAALISASTGKLPRFFGKPEKETADFISSLCGGNRDEAAIVGDRLYTDIAAGTRHGMTSVLVLSGETSAEAAEKAPDDMRPDFIVRSVAEIL
ncbi:MAG: HAD-IIA family hydrolase [Oscillospiraceae bacterium]|nr:HAD-IIA family hydrolase [Oscillospiraceae bacterium]